MDVFSQSPPIVECIFKHLPALDLENCAQVCQLWSSMSATELKRRKGVGWFFQCARCHIHNDHIQPGRLGSTCEENVPEFKYQLQEQLTNLRVDTKLCIALATFTFLERFPIYVNQLDEPDKKKAKRDTSLQQRKYLYSVIKTAIGSHLPTQCKTIFAVAPGLIGSLEDKFPFELEEGFAVSGFCFSNLPGVQIHHFPVDHRNCDLKKLIASDTKIKCLLAFLGPRGVTIADKLVTSCLEKERYRVAVGGAVVDRTEALLGTVVAFCGENVEAASLIIGRNDQKREHVTKKMEMFKDTGLLRNRCYAFMFSCIGRGYNLYQEHNMESLVFHLMYPEVPIIGVFGNGEIGVKYLPHLTPEKKVLRPGKLSSVCCHSYTSIWVLLSIKD